ncbi:retinoblastoma-like protein 2 isoform X1 [Bufo bufo]|uniref:retinoblastoma-like protein 2 isoform X1 n=2 Tax=Bufo bufo TaxID=8384 RepID=UPI001ABE1DE7|nr:retinoblastoma-like protein 2 isoform X1 [Bufo bufo]
MIKEEEEEGGAPQAEEQQQLRRRYEELCGALNMDERARAEAWESYARISQTYTLEGNALHWLACALYVACRQSVPTVGRGTAEGNYVSLTRILTSTELSMIEFFNKMKKWADMANLPAEFRERTKKLERNFTVTAVLFKKYDPIFQQIFKNAQEEQPRQHRSRKQRRQPCTVSEVFQFCWVLFINAKGNFPMISDDLVNSYHLLLCALDLVYGNALLCPNRRELLNPNFQGLPEDFCSKDFKPPSEPPCIIETLCCLHQGLLLEVKGIKEHFWKPYIHKLFDKKVLKGKSDSLTGFLEPGNFADSLKAITKAYEVFVLSVGHLDERVFLEDAEEEIGSVGRCLNPEPGAESSAERAQVSYHLQQHFDRMKSLRISTPLTSLPYMKESSSHQTPVSSATYSVSRLFVILSGHKAAPSEKLQETLSACSRNPTQTISNCLKEMFEVFCEHTMSGGGDSQQCKDIAKKYFRLAETLYYKVVESVVEREKKRLGDVDLSNILEQEIFHKSLIACCLEIIIFSYKPPGTFPQIIVMFDLAPYHFYKVIELVIKAEDGLCREVIKHLNQIEEQILESMAWTHDSPLWEKIRDNDGKVPLCEEVMHPHHFEGAVGSSITGSSAPLTSRRVNEIKADAAGLGKTSSPTLFDRYSSPMAGTARRRLFIDSDSPPEEGSPAQASPHSTAESTPSPVPGQTLVTMATATVTANNGQTLTIPVQGIANENGGITFFPVQVSMSGQARGVSSSIQPLTAQALAGPMTTQQMQVAGQVTIPQVQASPGQQNVSCKMKKVGSLALFCRRVYHLASVRLRDLCHKLDISDELRKKIWTCFEFSLVHCSDLMKDRHLDQLLMCAVYVMAKVTKEDTSFHDIMRCYRMQPHATSHVYRSVLLKSRRRQQSGGSDHALTGCSAETNKDHGSREPSPVMRSSSTLPVPQPSSAPPTPTRLSGGSSDVEAEERGDLVHFYNNVYIRKMKSFALKYSHANANEATPLSPYPSMRTLSPRRVQLSQSHQIFIYPHNDDSATLSPREKISYYFNHSPAKRLREINSMVRTGETPTKKRGILLEDGSESPAKRICQENHTVLYRKLQDVANDRGTFCTN